MCLSSVGTAVSVDTLSGWHVQYTMNARRVSVPFPCMTLHRGSVNVNSHVREGFVFIFTLSATNGHLVDFAERLLDSGALRDSPSS